MPAAWKNSATSRDSGALPETKNRIRPPKRSRSLENTSLSAMRCLMASSRPGGGLPAAETRHLPADAERPAEDLQLHPAGFLRADRRPGCRPSRRCAARRRRTWDAARRGCRRSCRRGRRPRWGSRCGPAPLRAPCRSSARAAATGSADRRPGSSPERVDRLALEDPAVVHELDALRLAGRARGVEQRRQHVGTNRGRDRLEAPGVRSVPGPAAVGEPLERRRPAIVGVPRRASRRPASPSESDCGGWRASTACAASSTNATRHCASARM